MPNDQPSLRETVAQFAAEKKGCSILDALEGLSFPEQRAAIKDLENKETGVKGHVRGTRWRSYENSAELRVTKKEPSDWFPTSLFEESYYPVSGKIDYKCSDYTDGGKVDRSKTVQF